MASDQRKPSAHRGHRVCQRPVPFFHDEDLIEVADAALEQLLVDFPRVLGPDHPDTWGDVYRK